MINLSKISCFDPLPLLAVPHVPIYWSERINKVEKKNHIQSASLSFHAEPVAHNLHKITYFCSLSSMFSKNNQIRMSCEYARVHSVSTLKIKHEILFSSFRGVMTNCFSRQSIFTFGITS